MYKRPTPRPLHPNVKNVPAATILYKGISNNARIYEAPVFFTFTRGHAQTYAKARLGEYATKKPLKLLHLTKKTLKYLLAHSELSQLPHGKLKQAQPMRLAQQLPKLATLLTALQRLLMYQNS